MPATSVSPPKRLSHRPTGSTWTANTGIAAIRTWPEIRDLLGRAGMDAAASSPDELTMRVANEQPRWGEVVKRKAITAE